jgi:hypothetical protein
MWNKAKVYTTILLLTLSTTTIVAPISINLSKVNENNIAISKYSESYETKSSEKCFTKTSKVNSVITAIKYISRAITFSQRMNLHYASAIKWIYGIGKTRDDKIIKKNIPITYFDKSKSQFITSKYLLLFNKDGTQFEENFFGIKSFGAPAETEDSIVGYKVIYSDNTSSWEYSTEITNLKKLSSIKSITAIQKGFTVSDAYINDSKRPIILKSNKNDDLTSTYTIKPGDSLFIHSVGKEINQEVPALVNLARLDNMPLKDIPSQRILVNFRKQDLDLFQQQYSSEHDYNSELDLGDSWVVTNGTIVFNERYRLFKGIYFRNSRVISTTGDLGLTHSGAPTQILGYTVVSDKMYFKTIIPVADTNSSTPYTRAYFEVPLSVYESKNKNFDIIYNTKEHVESIARSDFLDNINRITGYFPTNYSDTAVLTDNYFRYNLVNTSSLPLPEIYFTGLAIALRYVNNLFKYIERRYDDRFVILNKISPGTKEFEFANTHLSEFYLSSEKVRSISKSRKTIKDGTFDFSDGGGLFVGTNTRDSTHFGKKVKSWNSVALVVPRNDLWFNFRMNVNENTLLSYNDYIHGLIHEMGHVMGMGHTTGMASSTLLSPTGTLKTYYSRGSAMGPRNVNQAYTSLSDIDYGYILGGVKVSKDIIKEANKQSGQLFTTWFGFTEQDVQALWMLYSPSSNLYKNEV